MKNILLVLVCAWFCYAPLLAQGLEEIDNTIEQVTPEPIAVYRGFFNITQAGVLLGDSNQGEEAHTTVQSILGYQFSGLASFGVGMGIDHYADSKVFPIFADLRGYLLPNRAFNPFIFGSMGYGFTSGDGIENYVDEQRGGRFYQGGIGVKVSTESKVNFVFNIGWQEQSTYAKYVDFQDGLHERFQDYSRLTLRTGVYF